MNPVLQRAVEILRLGDDDWSRRWREILQGVQGGRTLSKRQSVKRARENLSRIGKAADRIARTLSAVDAIGLEALLLKRQGDFDIGAELARAKVLAKQAKAAAAAPFQAMRGENTRELIRVLAVLYEAPPRRGRATASNSEFLELVELILNLKHPAKEIRRAIKTRENG